MPRNFRGQWISRDGGRSKSLDIKLSDEALLGVTSTRARHILRRAPRPELLEGHATSQVREVRSAGSGNRHNRVKRLVGITKMIPLSIVVHAIIVVRDDERIVGNERDSFGLVRKFIQLSVRANEGLRRFRSGQVAYGEGPKIATKSVESCRRLQACQRKNQFSLWIVLESRKTQPRRRRHK